MVAEVAWRVRAVWAVWAVWAGLPEAKSSRDTLPFPLASNVWTRRSRRPVDSLRCRTGVEADAGAGAEAASSSLKSVRRGPLAEDEEEEDEEEDDDEEADGATEEEVVVVKDEDAVSVASLDLLATGHGGPDDVASPAPCCVERPLERPRRSTTRPTTTAPVAPAATMSLLRPSSVSVSIPSFTRPSRRAFAAIEMCGTVGFCKPISHRL